ncbi:MAG: hypothetical protein LBO08_01630 [Rickettsiales bacterium]|jgi:hypothetical protein|nr:hypothetical protein [Rickettsiales bacterium]
MIFHIVKRVFIFYLSSFIFLTAMPAFAASRATDTGRAAATITRAAGPQNISARTAAAPSKTVSARVAQTAAPAKAVVARAADAASAMSESRTGAEYEQCKSAYVSCMDQFCALKNDSYKRCSCSDRIFELENTKTKQQNVADELNKFNENLNSVALTAAQATSMKSASDGERALSEDGSASKALLSAIMKSIKGEDAKVGGKHQSLNSMDMMNILTDSDGQAIATYNGTALYTAIYNQCRSATRDVCNNASLQRAVTSYLMSIENDCNTLQTALNSNAKKLEGAGRESGAMLELARIENRKTHNSDDMATCVKNVELAVLSNEVCGPNYRKCLDNGKYIDISTGSPIAGIVDFWKLEKLLTFNAEKSLADQTLAQIPGNRGFVAAFETRVKKFAAPALDKCAENSDAVWADYLNKAMLDIYYAQKSKVEEIRTGCIDFVSSCYAGVETGLSNPMLSVLQNTDLLLQADLLKLNDKVCDRYITSCDGMFADTEDEVGKSIIADYLKYKTNVDVINSCRALVKQCFDSYGGAGYSNFYLRGSGIFATGGALDWFTMNKVDENGDLAADSSGYVSPCARQLAGVSACRDPGVITKAFGGFDYYAGNSSATPPENPAYRTKESGEWRPRQIGVATEIYNQILDALQTQCSNVFGRFVKKWDLPENAYNGCVATFGALKNDGSAGDYSTLVANYKVGTLYGANENMCPMDYDATVDVSSWGICSCWEYGAHRSAGGTSLKCILPAGFDGKNMYDQACPINSVSNNAVDSATGECAVGTAAMLAVPRGTNVD